VAYNDVESDNYTDFVASVNDFIQHECDNMWIKNWTQLIGFIFNQN
jgi:hypothetical protein